MFILQVICTVIFIYGILSLIQDILNEITYKKVSHNMKIVIFVKELEKYRAIYYWIKQHKKE